MHWNRMWRFAEVESMANLFVRSGVVTMELRKSSDQVCVPSGIRKTGYFDTTRFSPFIYFPFSTVGKAFKDCGQLVLGVL